MATARKKKTTKKAATRRKGAKPETWGLTAAQKRAAKMVKPRAETTPRKSTKRKSRAVPVAAHPPSPRGGRPCKACAKIHSKRQHGSHAEGPRIAHSYKTRAEGVYAKPRKAKKRAARKAK